MAMQYAMSSFIIVEADILDNFVHHNSDPYRSFLKFLKTAKHSSQQRRNKILPLFEFIRPLYMLIKVKRDKPHKFSSISLNVGHIFRPYIRPVGPTLATANHDGV